MTSIVFMQKRMTREMQAFRNHHVRWTDLAGSRATMALSGLGFLASCCYALAMALGLPLPRLRVEHGLAPAFALDLALLAAFALHFHFVQWPQAWRAPACHGNRRTRSPSALLQATLLVALVFGLWQPIPTVVWAVASPIAASTLWLGYATGWVLLLWGRRSQWVLVAGFCLVEWSAPDMTLGHLVFAIGLTGFVLRYQRALTLLARGSSVEPPQLSRGQPWYAVPDPLSPGSTK